MQSSTISTVSNPKQDFPRKVDRRECKVRPVPSFIPINLYHLDYNVPTMSVYKLKTAQKRYKTTLRSNLCETVTSTAAI